MTKLRLVAADSVVALVVVVVAVVQAIVPATVVATHPIVGMRADVVGIAVDIAVVDIVAVDIVAADTVAVDTVEVAIVDWRTHSVGHQHLHLAATNRNCRPNAVHHSVLDKCCLIWRRRMPQ